jgi:hypothetical protein
MKYLVNTFTRCSKFHSIRSLNAPDVVASRVYAAFPDTVWQMTITDVVTECLELFLRIPEVSGSNIGSDITSSIVN